jgi:two-component sensor histidine kinase
MTGAVDEAAPAGHGARAIEDRATRRAIADAREHRGLRASAEPAELDFAGYLDELCREVALATGTAGRVRLGCAVADGLLPAATAVRLGLIADELLANAFRHGFPAGRGGQVAVSFAATPDAWVLTVEDSGVGLPRGTPTGAGLRTAGALTASLGGELVFADVVAGTRCTVTLPRRWPSAVPDAVPGPADRDRAGQDKGEAGNRDQP